jgi:hypothetical protein
MKMNQPKAHLLSRVANLIRTITEKRFCIELGAFKQLICTQKRVLSFDDKKLFAHAD